MRWAIRIALLSCGIVPQSVRAQADCFPGPSSNEAKTFAILSAPLAFSRAAGAAPLGSVQVGFEGATVPGVPAATATPTICRPGKGPENTDPLGALGRIRVGAHHGGWVAEVGWIPPVRLNGVRANLFAIAVERAVPIGTAWLVSPRAHLLLGSLHAPVTCDGDAVADPLSECFEGTPSNDRWTPGVGGADATLTRRVGAIRPHLTVGYLLLRPRFQVDFTNAGGERDRRRVEVDLTRVSLAAGATVPIGRSALTAEGYLTSGDRVVFRAVFRSRLIE